MTGRLRGTADGPSLSLWREAPVKIELAPDVALVLFEWLERHADQGWGGLADAHSRELGALTVLAGALESKLVQPFDRRYADLVEAARQRLAEEYGIERDKDD